MPVVNPEKVVWYLESTLPNGEKVEGSAVAIRLQPIVKDANDRQRRDPGTARTYLLTCAHVLRGRSADGNNGFGKLVSEESIRAWMPGTGRNDEQAKRVRISAAIRRVDVDEIPVSMRSVPVDDWVVLELLDEYTSRAADALYASDFLETPPSPGRFRVVGYPAGAASHSHGVVTSTTTGPFAYKDSHLGLLRLVGTESAAGMSGGGVFLDICGEGQGEQRFVFCGLHRARQYDTLQLHSVSAGTVLKYFNSDAVPFELCREKPPEIGKPPAGPTGFWTRRSLLAAGPILAGSLLALYGIPRLLRKPAPTSAVVQIFDALTGDRIKRQFTVDDPNDPSRVSRTTDRFECEVPLDHLAQLDHVRVKCDLPGLYQETPKRNSETGQSLATSEDSTIHRLYLDRHEDFVGSISPDARRSTHLIDADIIKRRNENVLPPSEVVVVIDNRTDFRPDILFCPLFAFEEERLKLTDGGCFPIWGYDIMKLKKSEHHGVFDKPHVAAVFVSFEGQTAEFIGEGPLCSAPVLKITIEQRSSPVGKIEFLSKAH